MESNIKVGICTLCVVKKGMELRGLKETSLKRLNVDINRNTEMNVNK